jgi:hypothetical protein
VEIPRAGWNPARVVGSADKTKALLFDAEYCLNVDSNLRDVLSDAARTQSMLAFEFCAENKHLQ